MKKIIKSGFVVLAVAAIAGYGTYSYFSDKETSTGNTFQAGSIDLKVSNKGIASYGTVSTWDLKDLENGNLFFNFDDVKPGDWGVNSIGYKIDSNDSFLCAKIITTDEENLALNPEVLAGDSSSENTGELGKFLSFIWWNDTDADNNLDSGETILYTGPLTLQTMVGSSINGTGSVDLTIADSVWNVHNTPMGSGGPLVGGTTKNLGVGWCLGTLTVDYTQTTGIKCDGLNVTNVAQTDKVTGSLEFSAVQARNNINFLCPEHQPKTTTVQSAVFNFGGTGWAGWSCPVAYPKIVSANTSNCSSLLATSQAAKAGVVPYPTYPHHNYTAPEEGWVVQNGGTSQSCYIVLTCSE